MLKFFVCLVILSLTPVKCQESDQVAVADQLTNKNTTAELIWTEVSTTTPNSTAAGDSQSAEGNTGLKTFQQFGEKIGSIFTKNFNKFSPPDVGVQDGAKLVAFTKPETGMPGLRLETLPKKSSTPKSVEEEDDEGTSETETTPKKGTDGKNRQKERREPSKEKKQTVLSDKIDKVPPGAVTKSRGRTVKSHTSPPPALDNETAAEGEDAEPTFESFFGKQKDDHPEFPDTDYFLGGGAGGGGGGGGGGGLDADGFPDMRDLEGDNPEDYQETNPADYETEPPPAGGDEPPAEGGESCSL